MARGQIQVLVSVDSSPVWKITAPLDSTYIRFLTPQEVKTLESAFPELIRNALADKIAPPEPKPKKKKR
jgi:hypothetical protein